MSSDNVKIPEEYLNNLPLSAIVVKDDQESLNHEVVFVNRQFIKEMGYTNEDIPDKNTWWVTAYPDKDYQKVVAQQWELTVELYNPNESNYIAMEANICTKHHGTVRYKVYSEASDHLIPGHYIVMFSKMA